jgi:hypothetical protein
MTTLKALLLIPACFAGFLSAMPLALRGGRPGDRYEMAGMAAVATVTLAGLVFVLLARGPDRRFLGHSGRTWSVLCVVGFALGFAMTVVAF